MTPTIIPAQQAQNELAALGLSPDACWPDQNYAVFDHDWFLTWWIPGWRKMLQEKGWDKFLTEARDCDKFVLLAQFYAHASVWEMAQPPVAGLLFGALQVTTQFAFGRVPAGNETHRLCCLRTSQGWFAFEEQTDTVAPLADYPNLAAVFPSWPRF